MDIGHVHEAGVEAYLKRGFWMINGSHPPEWQEHQGGKAFNAVWQLNHLAIRLFRAPKARATYLAPNARFPIRFYPAPAKDILVDYRFHTLEEFDRCLVMETGLV